MHITHYMMFVYPYLISNQPQFNCIHSGHRLQNFEIRVGTDGKKIGNNVICFKQMEPMESGIAKNFTCSSPIYGSWISVNKSTDNFVLSALHFLEIRVYGGKYISTL